MRVFKKSNLIFFSILVFLIFPIFVLGGYIEELEQQIKAQEAKRLELEKQAAEYQAIINQKKGEIKSLSNQIAIFNAQIGKFETEIKITEDDITQTEAEIRQLAYGIGEAELDIIIGKSGLAKIIQAIAEFDQTSELEMILQSADFSEFFNQLAYLKQLQFGVQKEVYELKEIKAELNDNKTDKEKKKEELETLKRQLAGQQASLASQKVARQKILNYTKGEESKYQTMLANVEAQKKTLLGDVNRLRQLKASELAKIKEAQEKPPQQYWAPTNWYFAQDDPRWANTTIGISSSQMKNYGCAITSIAMVFTKLGSAINPGALAKEDIFAWDLIYWPKQWGSIRCQNCPPPHTSTFDWFKLDRELGAGYPVIVFVKAKGRGAGHYVVVHHKTADGRYVVHDPLFGDNIYLSSTQAYIGALYQTTTYLDQMIIYH